MKIKWFEEVDVLADLKAAKIHTMKPPGSTTEITQACDAGNCFKATKSRLKTISDSRVFVDNPMVKVLDNIFDLHDGTLNVPTLVIRNGTLVPIPKPQQMDKAHSKMAKKAILRVQHALGETITMSLIKDSFRKIGTHPLSIE